MKRIFTSLLALALSVPMWAFTVTDTIFNRYEHESFAFGADISFVPQMEGWGTRWLDKNGKQKDILQILKEQGINSIRLRVWTVSSGASSKQEVVDMCRRVHAAGMDVMIDFHYSDSWADPGKQNIPAAWTDHSVEALAQNVYDHTYDVLTAIKQVGVTPRWVQVGNETKRGMFYPIGQTNKGGSVAFAKFVLSGYNAVKAVDPSIQVIVHLPDGHDNGLYHSIFDGLKKNGAKWDIIGLSAYPRWSHLDGPTMISRVMSNMKDLRKRYGTPCMVVETGHYPKEAVIGNQYIVGLMDQMIKNGDLGCFYWEPESMGGYDMGAWDESTKRPTVMMDAFLGIKHTEVNWLMQARMTSPLLDQDVAGSLTLQADVKHVRNRVQSVAFYLDRKLAGTVTAAPYQYSVPDLEPGSHTAWVKAVDWDGNVQMSDTVTFISGRSVQMDPGVPSADDANVLQWDMLTTAPGRYRLLFSYASRNHIAGRVGMDGVQLGSVVFTRTTGSYISYDIEVPQAGLRTITLQGNSYFGLPDIAWLRVLPLDDQPLPVPGSQSAISSLSADDDPLLDVYTLSGVWLRTERQSQLGISMGDRSSALLVLPGSTDGAPNIVRRSTRQ
ncbi:MAG: glycosyl hydrolase 53 family protein [Bacteroidales bacterium]|nr:glycosyl hydrolase 53 family protein [Bacteroidales bacterium]